MSHRVLVLGDANVGRHWQAFQGCRPQLQGVPFRSVSCLDTFDTAMSSVTDELDYVLISVLTSMLLDEGSAQDVRGSCTNILGLVAKRLVAVAKKSSRVEVCLIEIAPFYSLNEPESIFYS